MGFDEIITKLGEFGSYQKRIYFLICLPGISCAFHKLAGVFLLAKPDFRCQLPYENDKNNLQYNISEYILNMSLPIDSLTGKWSTCQYYDRNLTDINYLIDDNNNNTFLHNNINNNNLNEKYLIKDCEKWIYDTSEYTNSAVTEWDMICNRTWLRAFSDSMFMLGVLLGSIIFGHMSDKYGRKPIFFASLVIQLIFGVLAGISPEYITYTISRIVIGATTSGVFLVAYVIALEMVGAKYRLFAGVVCMMFFSVGFMLTAVFAYFITDWRQLQIALTLPGILFMSYYWFIPESARWLLSKGRKQEAIVIIKKVAKVNNVDLNDDTIQNLLDDDIIKKPDLDDEPKKREASAFDLLRYPNLRRKSLLIFYDWFVNSCTYYALSWNTSNLGDNDLLNFVISGAVEIPAYTFLLFTLNRWGRRSILCGCMLFAGTSLLLTSFVPSNQNWLIVVLAMSGKLAITSAYGTVYIFSAEQFPTVIRNVGLGAASMIARVGGILAPYINLLADIWKPLPLIICGAMAFTGGLLSLLLPETHNQPMLETIEDGENFGKKKRKLNVISDHEEGQELNPIKNNKIINGQPIMNGKEEN